MFTVILKVVEMTLLKYPTWGESFSKTIHMLTMIMNEQQTMPYYLSDEIASKPYNCNWDNLLLIGLNFTAGSNQTSRLDIKIDKYIWLLLFFLFQSLKACVKTVWQSNYTLSNYDTFNFIPTHIESYQQHYLIILCTVRYSHTFIFSLQCEKGFFSLISPFWLVASKLYSPN